MLERAGFLVRCLLLAAEHHRDTAVRRELDHHVRALVRHPDVVLAVDLDGVRERPGIEVMADFPDEAAVRREFEELRRGCAIGWPRRIAARQHEDMAFGIERDARALAEVDIARQVHGIRDGIVGNGGDVLRVVLRIGETWQQCERCGGFARDGHETAAAEGNFQVAAAYAGHRMSIAHWFSFSLVLALGPQPRPRLGDHARPARRLAP
jgi:hypothetical protein